METNLRTCNSRQIVKQDREFLSEDWQETIELDVDPADFSLEKYFSAKTLISSRSFEIDSYHGFGMVPLADM
jgi:N-lysine methyltransferase SETD6